MSFYDRLPPRTVRFLCICPEKAVMVVRGGLGGCDFRRLPLSNGRSSDRGLHDYGRSVCGPRKEWKGKERTEKVSGGGDGPGPAK
jgi:hypothetical protein